MRAFRLATEIPWAITEEGLNNVLAIASRTNGDPEAVAAKLGRPLDNTRTVQMRGGVAVISIVGPLMRRADFFSRISGATSYETFATEFQAALESDEVRAIILDIDSPGGEVNGVSELADMIYAARGQKPVLAYVSGAGASGAYWIASAADEVVAAETAILGSVGVLMALIDTTKADEKAGIREIDIVASQSPKKLADPTKKEGHARIQALVDSLCEVFVAKVARNRGISRDEVITDFGEGWVEVGTAAVEAGLADRLGSLEGLIAELQERTSAQSLFVPASGGLSNSTMEATMDVETNPTPAAETSPAITVESVAANHPAIAAAFRREGAVAENARIHEIEAVAIPGHGPLVATLKQDLDVTAANAAMQILRAEKSAGASHIQALVKDEEALDAPAASASVGGEGATSTEEDLAKQIASAG